MVATRRMTAPRPLPPPPDLVAHPSEEKLITSFLRPRAFASASSGDDGPRAFIHDADVYSADPAELTAEFAPAVASNGDGAWYFFSTVRAKTRDGQRKARTVDTGEGCWHSEAGAKPVVDDAGRYLGQRQSFSFVTKMDGRRVRSGWLMVELSLDDGRGGGGTDMVLCKIYFSPRARVNGGAPAASASSSWLAGRKRKAAATGNNENNPASAARQQRRRRARSKTEAGAQTHDDDGGDTDDDAEEESTTQGGGEVATGSSAAGMEEELETDDSWTRALKERDRTIKECNIVIVDRSDEELLETLGLTWYVKTLNSFNYGDDMDPALRKA